MGAIQLEMLNCKKCGENIDAGNSQLFFYCEECGNGNYLENDEIVLIETKFYDIVDEKLKVKEGLPFWSFQAELKSISIDSAVTVTSIFNSLTGNDKKDQEASGTNLIHNNSKFTLYVPAYNTELDRARSISQKLTFQWDKFSPVPGSYKPFAEVCIKKEDAMKMGEFMLLSAVFQQPQLVKNISYQLVLESPAMSIISKKS